jgi:hypothetical protein
MRAAVAPAPEELAPEAPGPALNTFLLALKKVLGGPVVFWLLMLACSRSRRWHAPHRLCLTGLSQDTAREKSVVALCARGLGRPGRQAGAAQQPGPRGRPRGPPRPSRPRPRLRRVCGGAAPCSLGGAGGWRSGGAESRPRGARAGGEKNPRPGSPAAAVLLHLSSLVGCLHQLAPPGHPLRGGRSLPLPSAPPACRRCRHTAPRFWGHPPRSRDLIGRGRAGQGSQLAWVPPAAVASPASCCTLQVECWRPCRLGRQAGRTSRTRSIGGGALGARARAAAPLPACSHSSQQPGCCHACGACRCLAGCCCPALMLPLSPRPLALPRCAPPSAAAAARRAPACRARRCRCCCQRALCNACCAWKPAPGAWAVPALQASAACCAGCRRARGARPQLRGPAPPLRPCRGRAETHVTVAETHTPTPG